MSTTPAAAAATASSGTQTPEQSAQEVIGTIPDKDARATSGNVSAEDTSVDTEEASTEELEEVVGSKDATAAEKKEAAIELKKRMKFRVNGREVEKEIDLSDEESLQELLQKGFAADERFQSASAMEKRMRQFAELMQNDPYEALIAAGHDPDKLTEAYMKKRVEELSKSPEQLKLEQLQKEIEKERKERQRLEEEKLTAEQAKVESEYSRQLDEEITSALATSELPKSAYVVKRIAENLMIGIEQGNEDIQVQDVLPLVEKQIREEIQQMLQVMPEEVIERFLGDNVTGKLRKRRLAQAKASKAPETASSVKATGQTEINKTKAKESEAKPVKAADFFKNF
jgi:hypothetical protein